jgi:hypothetical protein
LPLDPVLLSQFRKQLHEAVEGEHENWTASRRLVSSDLVGRTIHQVRAALLQSPLDAGVRDALLAALLPGETAGLKGISGDVMRSITGLGPTKAVRSLCVLLGLSAEESDVPVSALAPKDIEAFLRATTNPYDLLLSADAASVIDLGAGDLMFEEQLVDKYLPTMEQTGKTLVVHALDRLDPEQGSALVQAERERLRALRAHPSPQLRFRFFGNQDMFALSALKTGCRRYTISVCHSPASPTFAYEPSRLSSEAIDRQLRETKGEYRQNKRGGQEVLEVRHGQEWLTFPPWKFDVYGPLALLDLLSRSGKLCVIGAVDMEVFLEILSQLLPDDSARPRDVFFTEKNADKFFGTEFAKLSRLAVGEHVILDAIRPAIPRVLPPERDQGETYSFRYVEVRRGAVFSGVPAGRTAHVFDQMTREAAPWCLTLVPSA